VSVAEPPDLGVAFALTKGDKPEFVVQKLTELGVRRIVPFRADRSVVRWDDAKADRNHERLVAIAVSALEQSRGAWLPIVEPLTDPASLASRSGVVRADRGGRNMLVGQDRLVVVGPEGGWTEAERLALPDSVGLPGGVLRAETAAIVAGALLVLR
jgi:16S rRNA (uracil1498-N3)-methyltransferase